MSIDKIVYKNDLIIIMFNEKVKKGIKIPERKQIIYT